MTNAPFISWIGHGAASLAPPGVFTDAKTNVFAVEADIAAMQTLVDTLLNPAAGSAVRYEAVLPVAMFSFMDIARCTSGTDIVGWLPGRECAIWVPLVEKHADPLHDRLVFWSPYIFISYTIGMLTGREAWGWPKVLGEIAVASDTPADPQFSCTTMLFPKLAADTRGEHGVLYRISSNTPVHPAPWWESAAHALEGMIGGFLGGVAQDLMKAFRLQPRVPSVVLKQFRAAGAPVTACFQAIVDSPIEITRFGGAGPLAGAFTVEITTCASHTIIKDLLGRAPDPGSTKLPVKFAAWATIDFQALTGDDIVKAS